MSQAGRYAHEQNTKRHAQRSFNQPKRQPAETIETATWMTTTMAECRRLADLTDNVWGIEDLAQAEQVASAEADRRLRKLSSLGFLQMGVERADGKFVRFTFGMVDVNLPL